MSMNNSLDELVLICGSTCSGKTHISHEIATQFSFELVEASSFMRKTYESTSPHNISINEFAHTELLRNPLIVAEQVLLHLDFIGPRVIVCGFRSLHEVRHIWNASISKAARKKCIYLEADVLTRFSRCVLRGRAGHASSLEDFSRVSDLQNSMGLSEIRNWESTVLIDSAGSLADTLSLVKSTVVRKPMEMDRR